MKRLILAALFLFVTGCAATTPRTGSVAISKFSVSPVSNRNVLAISNEAVENLKAALEAQLMIEIQDDTKLIPTKGSCTDSDYELTGQFDDIDTSILTRFNMFGVSSRNKSEISISGKLIDCKTKLAAVQWDFSKSDSNIMDLIEKLASKVTSKIKSVPAPVPIQ